MYGGLPHPCANSWCGAEYQGAYRQVRDEPDQEVPEEVGADGQDGADLVVDSAKVKSGEGGIRTLETA